MGTFAAPHEERLYQAALVLLGRVPEEGDDEVLADYLEVLDKMIEALAAVAEDPGSRVVAKCQLAELALRRTRDRMGRVWLSDRLSRSLN